MKKQIHYLESVSLSFLTGQLFEQLSQLHLPFDDFLIFLKMINNAKRTISIVIIISKGYHLP